MTGSMHAVDWQPCPTCWGEGHVPLRLSRSHTAVARFPCPTCGSGERPGQVLSTCKTCKLLLSDCLCEVGTCSARRCLRLVSAVSLAEGTLGRPWCSVHTVEAHRSGAHYVSLPDRATWGQLRVAIGGRREIN